MLAQLRLDAPFYCVHSHPARWSLALFLLNGAISSFSLKILASHTIEIKHIGLDGVSWSKTKPRCSPSGNDDCWKQVK
ncbi:hypothetical protein ATANTOWER_015581 [Ataeniobius toweri]|uniref:Secreted protein n=1 Tax=Ataeniobius toweri TaxID=208326 RepID=A0ABU7AZ71_9TELE|nr:hypothetical protein [Ataeniobius toweri]